MQSLMHHSAPPTSFQHQKNLAAIMLALLLLGEGGTSTDCDPSLRAGQGSNTQLCCAPYCCSCGYLLVGTEKTTTATDVTEFCTDFSPPEVFTYFLQNWGDLLMKLHRYRTEKAHKLFGPHPKHPILGPQEKKSMCLISSERTQKRDHITGGFLRSKRGSQTAIFGHKKFSLLFFLPLKSWRIEKN